MGETDNLAYRVFEENMDPARFVERELYTKGGHSIIYESKDTETGQTVALKRHIHAIPSLREVNDPKEIREAEKRFRSDSKALARLNHPGIVDAYGNFITVEDGEQVPYLVMELLEGDSLGEEMETGRVYSEDQIREAMLSGGFVLDFMHNGNGRQIIYRDFKPGNMIIMPENAEWPHKLVDFSEAHFGNATMFSGSVRGSPGYSAPEQWGGQEANPTSDLYSLAKIGIAMGLQDKDLFNKLWLNTTTLESLREEGQLNLSDQMINVFGKATETMHQDRYQGFIDMAQAMGYDVNRAPTNKAELEAILKGHSLESITVQEQLPTETRSKEVVRTDENGTGTDLTQYKGRPVVENLRKIHGEMETEMAEAEVYDYSATGKRWIPMDKREKAEEIKGRYSQKTEEYMDSLYHVNEQAGLDKEGLEGVVQTAISDKDKGALEAVFGDDEDARFAVEGFRENALVHSRGVAATFAGILAGGIIYPFGEIILGSVGVNILDEILIGYLGVALPIAATGGYLNRRSIRKNLLKEAREGDDILRKMNYLPSESEETALTETSETGSGLEKRVGKVRYRLGGISAGLPLGMLAGSGIALGESMEIVGISMLSGIVGGSIIGDMAGRLAYKTKETYCNENLTFGPREEARAIKDWVGDKLERRNWEGEAEVDVKASEAELARDFMKERLGLKKKLLRKKFVDDRTEVKIKPIFSEHYGSYISTGERLTITAPTQKEAEELKGEFEEGFDTYLNTGLP